MGFWNQRQTDEQERGVQTRPTTRTRPSSSMLAVAALLLIVAVIATRRGEPQQAIPAAAEPITVATIQVAPTVAPAPTIQKAEQPTPGFVEMSGIGVVTMDIADLGTSAAFFTKLAPTRMMLVVPNGDVSVSQLALGGTLFESSQVNNYLAVAFFEEARSVTTADQQGNQHTLTLEAGQYNLNWYDAFAFFHDFGSGMQFEVTELQLYDATQYPSGLGITPPGLANFVVEGDGQRYVLWSIWAPGTQLPFAVGQVEGDLILQHLLTKTVGGSYTAPAAPSVAPEGADAPLAGGGCPPDVPCDQQPGVEVITPAP